ncbi:MAG TPA: ABC transporter permease, partial [Vicinamibacterales bacterium]|nr:ABC transporter permease [Vicinamibacterales bacterium]
MGTLIRIGWTNLRRDRVAQAMTFLLPIIFFSIFATVFGGREQAMTPKVRIAVVDEDGSDISSRLVAALGKESALQVRAAEDPAKPTIDRQAAESLVRSGDVPAAIVIPKGFGEVFGQSGFGGGAGITLLADPSDPIASNMVGGLLQKVAMTAAPDLLMQGGLRQFESHAGALTAQQRAAVDAWLPTLKSTGGNTDSTPMGITVAVVDVMPSGSRHGSLISFYAAGIGVMFLLFSMVGAAGNVLLEEAESGTLERLLCTNLGMSGILAGKWAFLVLTGCAQLCVMFLWGRV